MNYSPEELDQEDAVHGVFPDFPEDKFGEFLDDAFPQGSPRPTQEQIQDAGKMFFGSSRAEDF